MRGDFLLLTHTTTGKKTPWPFQWRKQPRGASRWKKIIGESGGSKTLAPKHRSDVREWSTEARRATPPNKIRTEPNAADWTPVVQTVGERFNSNFFFSLFYPYYFLNAAVAPCLLLHYCIFWPVWGTHTCFVQTGFRSDRIFEILEVSGWNSQFCWDFSG